MNHSSGVPTMIDRALFEKEQRGAVPALSGDDAEA
jgi:hypothetical protein